MTSLRVVTGPTLLTISTAHIAPAQGRLVPASSGQLSDGSEVQRRGPDQAMCGRTVEGRSTATPVTATVRRVAALAASFLAMLSGIAYADSWPEQEMELAAAAEPTGLYTQHASSHPQAQIVLVRIDRSFSDGERADILRTAEEWNYVLNGYIRFEVEAAAAGGAPGSQPTPSSPGLWLVMRDAAKADMRVIQHGGAAVGRTWRLPQGGGIVTLAIDPFYAIELHRVALHEFGHVLGLDHDQRSHLMSVHYLSDEQRCVDHATVEILAALQHLPLGELNWCTSRSARFFSYAQGL